MTWCAVDVRVPAALREAVGTWLVGATGQAIEERGDGTLVGFLPSDAGSGELRAALVAAFGSDLELSTRPLEQVDWRLKWREGLGPRRIGRLLVTPSWIAHDPASATPTVVLDPEMAFGSGEHGSTRAALILLERHLRPGNRILDLGSGSGILAIAAVKLGACMATGIEMDEEANPVASRNALRNGVDATVRFLDGDAAILTPLLGPAEIILSNILRNVNVTLLDAIGETLAPGGLAIFSGMERDEAPLFLPELAAHRFLVVDQVEDSGWWAVAARRS